MAISTAILLCDEAVYARTVAGQREAIFGREPLAPMARQLLLLANGETPLRRLLDLLQLQDVHVSDAILELVDRGLVEIRIASRRAASRNDPSFAHAGGSAEPGRCA
jgi:hypothetical protein